jgi:hypothetical protein
MRSSGGKTRLDVPGFSFGVKTGEFVDVPRIFGGRGAKRKSGKPHTYSELASRAPSRSVAIASAIARHEYNKGKRFRLKQKKQPKTNHIAAYCLRRYLELSGLKTYNFAYAENPELIIPKPKIVYEVTDGLLPWVTFTSSREAMLMCATLARFGIAAYFNSRKIYP